MRATGWGVGALTWADQSGGPSLIKRLGRRAPQIVPGEGRAPEIRERRPESRAEPRAASVRAPSARIPCAPLCRVWERLSYRRGPHSQLPRVAEAAGYAGSARRVSSPKVSSGCGQMFIRDPLG